MPMLDEILLTLEEILARPELQTLIFAGTAIILFWQLKALRKATDAAREATALDGFNALAALLNSKESVNTRKLLYDYTDKVDKLSSRDQASIKRFLVLLDQMGTLVNKKLIPEDVAIEMYWDVVIKCWDASKSWIGKERSYRNEKYKEWLEGQERKRNTQKRSLFRRLGERVLSGKAEKPTDEAEDGTGKANGTAGENVDTTSETNELIVQTESTEEEILEDNAPLKKGIRAYVRSIYVWGIFLRKGIKKADRDRYQVYPRGKPKAENYGDTLFENFQMLVWRCERYCWKRGLDRPIVNRRPIIIKDVL